jgi:hypothetical protein
MPCKLINSYIILIHMRGNERHDSHDQSNNESGEQWEASVFLFIGNTSARRIVVDGSSVVMSNIRLVNPNYDFHFLLSNPWK